jgi:hypothetical protein
MFASLLAIPLVLAAAAEPSAGPALPKLPPPRIDVRPVTLQLNSYMQFDDAGNIRTAQQNCYLNVKFVYSDDLVVTGCRSVKLTQIVADNGAKLAPPPNMNGPLQPQQRGLMQMGLALPQPPNGARAFSEISGVLTVQIAVGATKLTAFGPIKDIEGKHTPFGEGGDQVFFTLRREKIGQINRVSVEMPQRAGSMLSTIRFLDEAGKPINTQDGGAAFDGSNWRRFYMLDLPDTAKVELQFYGKIEDVDVPFSIRDLPLKPGVVPVPGGKPAA